MAYRIDQHGQQWHVIHETTGNILGRHTDQGSAKRQLDAIYSVEPTARVEDLMAQTFDAAADRHHLSW